MADEGPTHSKKTAATTDVRERTATVVLEPEYPNTVRALGRWLVTAVLKRFRLWLVLMACVATTLASLVAAGVTPVDLDGIRVWHDDRLQRARIDGIGGLRFPQQQLQAFRDRNGPDAPLPSQGDEAWNDMWNVVIVRMDEQSYRALDGYPFSPEEDARVVETLAGFGVRVVAFDRLYSERREKFFRDGVQPLVRTIDAIRPLAAQGRALAREGTAVVMSAKREPVSETTVGDEPDQWQAFLPLPELGELSTTGYINVKLGRGRVVRDYRFVYGNDELGWSLPMAIWLTNQRTPGQTLNEFHNAWGDRFRSNTVVWQHVRRQDPVDRTLNFYGAHGKPFIHTSFAEVWRAWPLVRVAQVKGDLTDAEEILGELTVSWEALSAYIGEPMTIRSLNLPKLATIPATLETLLTDGLPDGTPLDARLQTAILNMQDGLQWVNEVIEPYQQQVTDARAMLVQERANVVRSIADRSRSILEAIASLDNREVLQTRLASFGADLAVDSDDDAERAAALTKVRMEAAMLFSPDNLAHQLAIVADALEERPSETAIAVLSRLRADLEMIAMIDRQQARLDQFPIPPDPDEDRLRRMLGGKVAIIGPWTLDSQDLYSTPLSRPEYGELPVYGVELHATALQNLYEMLDPNADEKVQAGVRSAPVSTRVWATVIATLAAGLIAILAPPLVAAAVVALGGWGYQLIVQRVFVEDWVMLPYVYPIFFGALLGYFMVIVTRALTVDQERKLIDNLFKSYMDRRFVEMLKDDPDKLKLGGQKREITVFFSDIAGFSAISEKLEPEELVALINEYLGEMSGVILRYDGTLDKYIGDAIMAFWNAPVDIDDAAAKACWSAVEQRERLLQLQARWASRGLPHVDCRMGINTGMIVHGNMGSEVKMNYTLMGDDVNLAARFEPLNKDFDTRIIIGETTWRLAQEKIEARRLGRVRVKGRHQPSAFYELLGRKDDVPAATMEMVEVFHVGLEAYFEGDFVKARDRFLAALTIIPEDGPARRYLELVEGHLENPPDKTHWNGVYIQTTK